MQVESHVRTPENADYAIACGAADLVSIVRGQIADPHLVRKALAGRPDDVRGVRRDLEGRGVRAFLAPAAVGEAHPEQVEPAEHVRAQPVEYFWAYKRWKRDKRLYDA